MFNEIITDELIEEIKQLQENTAQLKILKSKIRNIKKGVRKLCREEKITFLENKLPQGKYISFFNDIDKKMIIKAINDFDKLCLAVGCKRSFTKTKYDNKGI